MNQSIPVLFTRPCKEREIKEMIPLLLWDPREHGYSLWDPTNWWMRWTCPKTMIKTGFPSLGTTDIWPDNPQWWGCLCIVGCLATPVLYLLDTSYTQPTPPSCDNQKCLQALTSVPWGAKLPLPILGTGSATSMTMPEFSKWKGAESYLVYIMGLEAGTVSFSSC